jgi:hypothetical protein
VGQALVQGDTSRAAEVALQLAVDFYAPLLFGSCNAPGVLKTNAHVMGCS